MHNHVGKALLWALLSATFVTGAAGVGAAAGAAPAGAAAPSASSPQASTAQAAATATDERPNIVLITTDDQALSDMQWMPMTRRYLGGHGVTFTDALAPHPQCCPARAGVVTGQYGQNNGVRHNRGEFGGFPRLVDPANTVASWLQDSGYLTAQMGKYMNGYAAEGGWQAGWTHWNASVSGEYSFDRTVFFNDGNPVLDTTYIADAIRRQSRAWVQEFSAADQPFFIWASQLAPHQSKRTRHPFVAERHREVLRDVRAPHLDAPSFNVAPDIGQPVFDDPRSGEVGKRWVQRAFKARIRSLQSVDEMVRGLVRQLETSGELDNTYLFFASDNGYLLGEHQLLGKNALYKEALAVPMLVRVPGSAGATVSDVPVTLTDLAPTIADIAGVVPGRLVDGQSFLPVLTGRSMPWRDTQLVQTGTVLTTGSQPGWEWRGARTSRYTYGYSPQTGQQLLFDRSVDPAELNNFATKRRYAPVVNELHRRTQLLENCAGPECQMSFGAIPAPKPRR